MERGAGQERWRDRDGHWWRAVPHGCSAMAVPSVAAWASTPGRWLKSTCRRCSPITFATRTVVESFTVSGLFGTRDQRLRRVRQRVVIASTVEVGSRSPPMMAGNGGNGRLVIYGPCVIEFGGNDETPPTTTRVVMDVMQNDEAGRPPGPGADGVDARRRGLARGCCPPAASPVGHGHSRVP